MIFNTLSGRHWRNGKLRLTNMWNRRNEKKGRRDLRIGASEGRRVGIKVNGRPLLAREGETVHGALLAGGIRSLRRSRKKGEKRGGLCGMGVCCECLVTIDGEPDRRACMTLVEERMEVETDED